MGVAKEGEEEKEREREEKDRAQKTGILTVSTE